MTRECPVSFLAPTAVASQNEAGPGEKSQGPLLGDYSIRIS